MKFRAGAVKIRSKYNGDPLRSNDYERQTYPSGVGAIRANMRREMVDPGNVISAPLGRPNAGHPAAFPPPLPEFFIRLLSDPGDLVLDPFAGSGTTLRVAETLGRRAIGIERMPEYYRLCRESMRNIQVEMHVE